MYLKEKFYNILNILLIKYIYLMRRLYLFQKLNQDK